MQRFIAGVLVCSVFAVWTGSVRADGFPDGRDADVKFTVEKNDKTSVKMESSTPAERVKAVAKELTGTLTLNPAKLDKAEGTFTVPIKNFDTALAKRNEHMLGADWMDAEKYPDRSEERRVGKEC
jgi:polyisoprenoid-binding protein YceI